MSHSFWLEGRSLTPTPRTVHTMTFVYQTAVWQELEIAQWVHHEWYIQQHTAPWANAIPHIYNSLPINIKSCISNSLFIYSLVVLSDIFIHDVCQYSDSQIFVYQCSDKHSFRWLHVLISTLLKILIQWWTLLKVLYTVMNIVKGTLYNDGQC